MRSTSNKNGRGNKLRCFPQPRIPEEIRKEAVSTWCRLRAEGKTSRKAAQIAGFSSEVIASWEKQLSMKRTCVYCNKIVELLKPPVGLHAFCNEECYRLHHKKWHVVQRKNQEKRRKPK